MQKALALLLPCVAETGPLLFLLYLWILLSNLNLFSQPEIISAQIWKNLSI